jgi:hypothetical protein
MIETAAIEANARRGRELAASLTLDQFARRPARDAWSIGECLAHLNAVNGEYAKVIDDAIAGGKANRIIAPGPFKLTGYERFFVWAVGPPARLKMKAPGIFLPEGGLSRDEILAEWDRSHQRLVELARAAEGLDLARIRVQSPASARVKISLLAAFAVIDAHDRRHLWQADRIKAKLPGRAAAAR